MSSRPPEVVKTLAQVETHSPEETIAFGRNLAREVQPPCLVLLEGELGSGKTTLVKGLVAGLDAAKEEEVTSPSFTLVHEYGLGGRVYHADLYRIEDGRELGTLGLDELESGEATIFVEWGEKLGHNVPTPCIRIRLEHLGSEDRRIIVERVEA